MWLSQALLQGVASSVAASLLLTYVAHSLLFAAAAALLVRSCRLSAASQHSCWKFAIFAPFLSAALAVGQLGAGSGGAALAAQISVALPSERAHTVVLSPQLRWACWLLLAVAAGGPVRFVGSAVRLARRLRPRRPVTDPRWLQQVQQLCARTVVPRVVLTHSADVESPLVLGTSEICLPSALLSKLAPEEVDAVLAHELAHLERRDGLWFPLVGAVQALSWLYPLGHWSAARFRDSAELASDDRALELTRNPNALARALLQVAENASVARQLSFFPTMAGAAGALLPRARRLASSRGRPPKYRAWARALPPLVAALLGGVLAVVGIRVARAAPVDAALDPALIEQSAEMLALSAQAQRLEAELGTLAARDGSGPAVRALELEQELRHVRATQVWIEQRLSSVELGSSH